MAAYTGKCHCGELRFVYTTSITPSEWTVRSCQCSFCRAHGVRATRDPSGSVRFEAGDAIVRYEFGQRTAQFLICGRCGVYVAAVMASPRGRFATVNVNALYPAPEGLPAARPVTYDEEAPAQRIARREQGWTPVIDPFPPRP